MAELCLRFEGFRTPPYVTVDGKEVRGFSSKLLCISLEKGRHHVFVCERRSLFRFYWWWRLLSPFHMLSLFRGFGGNPLGFDGECVHATFAVDCEADGETSILLQKREVPWETTEAQKSYHTLLLSTRAPISLIPCELSPRARFRLKFDRVSPLYSLTLLVLFIFAFLGVKKTLTDPWELVLNACIILYLALFTGYRTYKAVKDKSFFAITGVSRVKRKPRK